MGEEKLGLVLLSLPTNHNSENSINKNERFNWKITHRNMRLKFEGYAMKPSAEALINREISSVGVYLFNKIKRHVFEKEPIEKTVIRETDFEKIIEEKTDSEDFPVISQADIKAICGILYKSNGIELIVKQLYVFQSGMNKNLDEIKEDFVSLFPRIIKLENKRRNLETEERRSFLLKVFEVLDEGIQIALNRAANEGSSGASNALSNRRHFDMKNEFANGFKDVKKLISDSFRENQKKEIPAENSHSLFISYAREDDTPFVEQLYQDLTARSFNVWWDRAKMKSRGRTFLQEIRDAIVNADILIAVIGPKAIESDTVKSEWGHALLFGKVIVPILCIGDHTLLPPNISKLHCTDFREKDLYKKALEELLQILREPIPSLGPIFSVPSPPPNYLDRAEYLEKMRELILADVVKTEVITSEKNTVALHGMGGMGKSVLSAAFARNIETRRAFCDGIFWITVGLEPDLIEDMRYIGTKFGDDIENYSSKREAEASISRVLSDKVCLIILDNVWKVPQATPFVNALGSRCRLLITTRNGDVVTLLGAQEHKIEVLSEPRALKLLANWGEQEVDSLPSETTKVARECGYLPLALSICGAMAKSGISWSHILEALQAADLEFIEAQLPNYPDPNVGKALKVSVDFLSSEAPNAVLRYQELVIFPEDEFIAEAAIATLWEHTGNLKKRDVEGLLVKLKDRSLLQLDGKIPNRHIYLHGLQSDYLVAKSKAENVVVSCLHNQLLEAYSKICSNKWTAGPEDEYFYKHLPYHMKEAGKKEELRKLLLDFDWMRTKLEKVCVIQDETGIKKPDVNSLLRDYDSLPDDTEIGLVQGAIRLSFNAIIMGKDQLSGQLLGRLLCFHEDGIKSLLSQVRECRDSIRLLPKISSLQPPGGQLIRILEGHDGRITAVAITDNGEYVVSASSNGTVKIWNLTNGEEKTLKGHDDSINEVAVTPDGRFVLSASDDRTLKFWDLQKGTEKTLKGHNGRVTAVAVTDNGKFAISASLNGSSSDNGTLKVWNLESGEEKITFRRHNAWVKAVAITPNADAAVSASFDGMFRFWDLEQTEEIRTLGGQDNNTINAVAITPSGDRSVSVSFDRTLKVWDLIKREEKILKKNDEWVNAVAITSNGKYAVFASSDGTLNIWDLEKQEEKTILKGHGGRANAVAITFDGRFIVSASDDRPLNVWDLKKIEEKTITGHNGRINAVAIASKGKYAISASSDGTLKVWDLEKINEVRTLKGHNSQINAVATTPTGECLVSASLFDGIIKVWNLTNGEEKTLKGIDGWIESVAVTDNGKYVVSASSCGIVKIYNLENGEEKMLKGHKGGVKAVVVTPKGDYAISASDDKTLVVWDLEKGEEKLILKGHEEGVAAVTVTPNQKYVISVSNETLKVWNLDNGEVKATFKGHYERVNAVFVTSDSQYAISASDDRTVKVWDIEKEKEKTTLRGHNGWVMAVTATADGKYVISASYDGTIRVWDLEKGENISCFTGDNSFWTCDVLPDLSQGGELIIAGDTLGKMHFLHFDKPD